MMKKVTSEDVIVKKFYGEDEDSFLNELFFYREYPEFAPKLIAYNAVTKILVIEKCTPILDIDNNVIYKEKLSNLLERLHKCGVNHRDVALINVVVKDDEPLLIDWEAATTNVTQYSYDLHGNRKAKHDISEAWTKNYGEDGIWWGGPWDMCPGKYWAA